MNKHFLLITLILLFQYQDKTINYLFILRLTINLMSMRLLNCQKMTNNLIMQKR